MHQYSRLAGTGTGEYQHVCLLPIIRDDTLLNGIFQAFDDGPPRFGRSLPCNLLVPIWQPTAEEILLLQAEVVNSQMQSVGHVVAAPLREFRHHVNLPHLPLVMEIERCKVGVGKAAPRLLQPDGHGRTEYRQALVKADDLLLV